MGFKNISFSKRLDLARTASPPFIFCPKQATSSRLASSDSRSQSRSSRSVNLCRRRVFHCLDATPGVSYLRTELMAILLARI